MDSPSTAIQPVPDAELAEHQALFDRLVEGMSYMVALSALTARHANWPVTEHSHCRERRDFLSLAPFSAASTEANPYHPTRFSAS